LCQQLVKFWFVSLQMFAISAHALCMTTRSIWFREDPMALPTGATLLNLHDVKHAGFKVVGDTSLKLFTVRRQG
jgi:hypothetical protein